MSSVPPGWYPDPAPQTSPYAQQRWWDGARWTDHLQPAASGSAPVAARPTGPTTPDGRPLGGRGWRLLAWIVDGIALGITTTLLTLPVQIEVQREVAAQQRELERQLDSGATPGFDQVFGDTFGIYADHALILFVVPALLTLAYHAFFLRWRGATPGKMACKLRVERLEGSGTLPWSSIAARLGVQQVLPLVGMLLAFSAGSGAGFALAYVLTVGFLLLDVLLVTGPTRRTLHDRVAGTTVINLR